MNHQKIHYQCFSFQAIIRRIHFKPQAGRYCSVFLPFHEIWEPTQRSAFTGLLINLRHGKPPWYSCDRNLSMKSNICASIWTCSLDVCLATCLTFWLSYDKTRFNKVLSAVAQGCLIILVHRPKSFRILALLRTLWRIPQLLIIWIFRLPFAASGVRWNWCHFRILVLIPTGFIFWIKEGELWLLQLWLFRSVFPYSSALGPNLLRINFM